MCIRDSDKMAEVKRQNEASFGGHGLSEFVSKDDPSNKELKKSSPPSTRKRGRTRPYIGGPVDLEWIQKACQAKGIELALYIHYKTGILGKGASVQIRPTECKEFGLNDKSRQRQVDRLASAGLITAQKGKGKCPVVRITQ